MQLGANQLLRDPINDLRYFLGFRLRFILGRHLVAVQDIHDFAPFSFCDDIKEVVRQVFVDTQVRLLVLRAMTAQAVLCEKRNERLAVTRLVDLEFGLWLSAANTRQQ